MHSLNGLYIIIINNNNNMFTEKDLQTIINKGDKNWFTTALKGEKKRYIVAFTHNITLDIAKLYKQIGRNINLHNINVGGRTDLASGTSYIDASTSFNSLDNAKIFWKKYNQIAIYDMQEWEEIRIK